MAGTPEQHIWILRQQLEESAKWLEAETRLKVEWKTKNGQLKADIEERKEAYTKLEKHAKACEKATGKAQRDANHAVGLTNHLLSTQKGQLKSAERRYGEAARDLKQWRDKYGWSVNKPAEENDALQASLSEWQSKAEKAQNVIASLEEQVQGTPDQVGLHQALEEWTEHQACSEEFAKLEDKIHDGLTVKQKLESDLSATKEQYQKALEELQVRVNELEQANKALQPVQVTADQVEQANKTYQGVQVTAEQLEQADKTFQELQGKAGQYELHIQKLQADLEAGKEQHQEVEAYMKALLAVLRQAQQADEASEDQVQTDDINMSDDQIRDEDMLDDETLGQKKLMLGLKALAERYQKKESDQKALQEESDQLASDLKTTKEQWQIAESNMNILQETADQLESSLKTTKDQYQTTKSKMDALQTKADQLEQTNTTLQEEASQLGSDLKTTKEQWQIAESNMNILQETADQLESSLKTTKDQYQTKKSHMDALQTKADQLEQTNTTLQEEASQLELDLKITKDQHQATKSNMDALQTKADQLEQTNTTLQEEASQLEADLKITKEQFHTAKVKMDGLEEQADQLEVANETLHQVTDKVQDELKTTREQYRRANLNMEALQDEASELKKTSGTFEGKTNRKLWSKSDAVPQDIEERMQLVTAQKELSKKAEQDTETSQRSQVSIPVHISGSSPFLPYPTQSPYLC